MNENLPTSSLPAPNTPEELSLPKPITESHTPIENVKAFGGAATSGEAVGPPEETETTVDPLIDTKWDQNKSESPSYDTVQEPDSVDTGSESAQQYYDSESPYETYSKLFSPDKLTRVSAADFMAKAKEYEQVNRSLAELNAKKQQLEQEASAEQPETLAA